ncbi:methyltransferase family protein [Actinomyces bowdenii]|uniref:Isoprenylcysteine carboxylmethyltransferase family protein n=1 Tax=Actinomyces bowdenii TaxID=131109 RepID=A0A3P1UKT6_9ACTO|nr:isoprenylcysteine carboxylmethyltransferase family protein [Actinomyces bowdenii]MDO5065371.1 isoprenylcysteine carboxylmethyltransferase family protein [Actinomyces bowdenii]RRD22554.1 isoprenylcysteine carboxylmethyltransferase family protein [Actinomyces bowdenii]
MGARVPPVVVLAAAGAAQRLTGRRRKRTARSVLASTVTAGLSGALILESVVQFARHRTTVDPHGVESASTLVTTGPHALTRNPMYVGMLGLLVARAVARRRRGALLPAAGFWWAMDRFQIPAEERALAERFGQDYEDYQNRVPRWLWQGEAGSHEPAEGRTRHPVVSSVH